MGHGVYHYENPSLQQEALNVMPVSELKQKAKEACEKSKENGQDGVDEKDCLFLEVARWFGMNACIFSNYFVIIVEIIQSSSDVGTFLTKIIEV